MRPGAYSCHECRDASRTAGYVLAPRSLAKSDPLVNRAMNLWRHYRMTIEEYDALRAHQGDRCAVCRRGQDAFAHRRPPGRPRGDGTITQVHWLQVDHCHTTHRVRGLLCPDCNAAAARLHDSAERARGLADYLARAEAEAGSAPAPTA